MLGDEAMKQVIVFARTKHGADAVTAIWNATGSTPPPSTATSRQNARQRALNGFRDGKVRILVATDIAARGIDVHGITHVVNYDLPDEAESYVHRIGRTGRNGADGIAITLCDPSENSKLRQVERIIRARLPIAASHLDAADPAPQPRERPAKAEAGEGRGERQHHRPNGSSPAHKAGRKPFHGKPAQGEKREQNGGGDNRHALPRQLTDQPEGKKPFRNRKRRAFGAKRQPAKAA